MKKLLLILLVFASGVSFAGTPVIDEKILKSFQDAFPKAEKVTWYEESGNYQVLFTCEQIKCRMWFDNKGNALQTIRYYYEQNLCPFVMTKVKQKFAGKQIYGITEVSTDRGVVYNIILEDEKKWYHVKVDTDGSVQLEKKYIKA
ncbi:MAG TPA: hypothetical protein VM888_00295 [Chitinophagaceae bacterium]|jgi:hypothetical protein|nr:hypothetical protein [Chitinophagaceae bacterium]